MNNKLGRQSAGRGHDGFARGKPVRIFFITNAFTFLENGVAALRMDRPINASTAQQRLVRSVHDRVYFLLGYVSERNYDFTDRFTRFIFVHSNSLYCNPLRSSYMFSSVIGGNNVCSSSGVLWF